MGVKQNVKHFFRGLYEANLAAQRKFAALVISTFDKHRPRFAGEYAGMAQLVAHLSCNQRVFSVRFRVPAP